MSIYPPNRKPSRFSGSYQVTLYKTIHEPPKSYTPSTRQTALRQWCTYQSGPSLCLSYDRILLYFRLGHMLGTDRTWFSNWLGGEHGVIKPVWWNDWTFYKTILTQAGFIFFARVSHMDDWKASGELEILAYVRVEDHSVHILDILDLPAPYSVHAWPQSCTRTERPVYTEGYDTLLGGRGILVFL